MLEPNEGIDLRATSRTLWERRKTVLSIALAVLVVTIIANLVVPRGYRAKTTILPNESNGGGSAMTAVLSQLGSAGTMLGLGSTGRSADLIEVLKSRLLADRLITHFKLDQRLKGWKLRSELVTKVTKMLVITPPGPKSKLIAIEVLAPDPELAQILANGCVDELKGILDEIGYNSSSKNRRFIEEQLSKSKVQLADAENALVKFQEQNRMEALPEIMMEAIRSIGDLESRRVAAEAQLRSTQESLGELQSKVQALQADPNQAIQYEIKQRGLQAESQALSKAKSDYLARISRLPPRTMQLARLQRDVQVQNAVYLALTQQYQTAILGESRESDAFMVLDRAEKPYKPSEPKRTLNTLIGAIVGLLLGVGVALGMGTRSFGPELR